MEQERNISIDLKCDGEAISYIRVSAKDQSEARQLKTMRNLGIPEKNIFVDKASGKDFDRPKYLEMKRYLRKADLVVIDSLDRLGRNYDGIIDEWKEITRKMGADIVVVDNAELFDSRKFKAMGEHGKLMEDQFLSLLAYVAEQERLKIKRRQQEGIAIALENGIEIGRPKINLDTLSKQQFTILEQNYFNWQGKLITGVQFMEMLNLKKNTFYKIIKQYEEKLENEKVRK